MTHATCLRRMRCAAGCLLLTAFILTSHRAWSQQNQAPPVPSPRLHVVAPSGAKAGTSFDLTLSGHDLDEASELLFSVPGVKSELVSAPSFVMQKGNQQRTNLV